MKTFCTRIVNVTLSVLLLITLSYSIPSIPRQRIVSQTEWIRIAPQPKPNTKHAEPAQKPLQASSLKPAEFVFRILDFANKSRVSFHLSKSPQFTCIPTRFTPAKIVSDDDDYLLL